MNKIHSKIVEILKDSDEAKILVTVVVAIALMIIDLGLTFTVGNAAGFIVGLIVFVVLTLGGIYAVFGLVAAIELLSEK